VYVRQPDYLNPLTGESEESEGYNAKLLEVQPGQFVIVHKEPSIAPEQLVAKSKEDENTIAESNQPTSD